MQKSFIKRFLIHAGILVKIISANFLLDFKTTHRILSPTFLMITMIIIIV